MEAHTSYITIDALRQVNLFMAYTENEALNTSVAAFAPKGKTYSMTNSLLARVSIAAGVSIAGHEKFWKNVAAELEFTFDDNFISQLKACNGNKQKSRVFQRSKEGKTRRSQTKYKKQNEVHKTQLDVY